MSQKSNINITGDSNETNIVVDASTCDITIKEQLVSGPPGPTGPSCIHCQKNKNFTQIYYNSGLLSYELLDLESDIKNPLIDNSELSSIKYLLLEIGGSSSVDSIDLIPKIKMLLAKYKELGCIMTQKEIYNRENYNYINYREKIYNDNNICALLIKDNGTHPINNIEFNNNFKKLEFNESMIYTDLPTMFLFDLREHKYIKIDERSTLTLPEINNFMEEEKNSEKTDSQESFTINTTYVGHKASIVNLLPFNNFVDIQIPNSNKQINDRLNKKLFVRIDEHIDNLGSIVSEDIKNTRLASFKETLINKINDTEYYESVNVDICEVITTDNNTTINVNVSLKLI